MDLKMIWGLITKERDTDHSVCWQVSTYRGSGVNFLHACLKDHVDARPNHLFSCTKQLLNHLMHERAGFS